MDDISQDEIDRIAVDEAEENARQYAEEENCGLLSL
jgi:anti-sigma regulatory factor (Ser/Thr protein kinase)